MAATIFQDIRRSLRQLYLEHERPWLVRSSGGKESIILAPPIFHVVLSNPSAQRKKQVPVLCARHLSTQQGGVAIADIDDTGGVGTQFPPASRARGRTCSSTALLLTTRVNR